MLQVDNRTPFETALFCVPDETGVDAIVLAIKATFDLGPTRLCIAQKQHPLVLSDAYRGEPGASSLHFASEVHLQKPGTDVVLVGSAYAPGGRPATTCHASIVVGSLRKTIAVFGDRTWVSGVLTPRISSPLPFVEVPLVYERAFGGTVLRRDRVVSEPRNPVGVGLRAGRASHEMLGEALPNLEDPREPISSIDDAPAPWCTGCVAPSWLPRRSFAGTYDATWARERAPFLPTDFQSQFFSVASAGLWSRRRLVGDEPVELRNLTPDGLRVFRLPSCEFAVEAHETRRTCPMRVELETVLLEPCVPSLSLSWRGVLQCDKRALRVSRVSVALRRLAGAGEAR